MASNNPRERWQRRESGDLKTEPITSPVPAPKTVPPSVESPKATVPVEKISQSRKRARRNKAGQQRAGADARGQRKQSISLGRLIRHVGIVIICSLLVLFLGCVAAFCVVYWAFDDSSDIMGRWTVEGTNTSITITESQIQLTDTVAYDYVMDRATKIIDFKFGNDIGEGYYRFSLDRSRLSISDGSRDLLDGIIDDIQWTAQAAIGQIGGNAMSPRLSDEAIVLVRDE